MTFDTRSLPGAEIRSFDDDSHELSARVLSYNVADRHGTVWSPGVFTDSLKRSLPPILFQHDMARVIGRVISFEDHPDGLDVRARLADPEKVPDAAMAYSLLKDGIIGGFSVGFAQTAMKSIPSAQRSAFGDNPARELATRGYLGEISVTAAPSVPATKLLALRTDGATGVELLPTVDEIMAMRTAGVISEATAERMVLAANPGWREHIAVVDTRATAEPMPATDPAPADGDDDGDDDTATLAAAVDAALDEACDILADVDLTTLPDNVQQAVALVNAAGVAVDQLLAELGIPDPDDDDTTGRSEPVDGERAAAWNPKIGDYTPAQWKNACLIDTGTGDPDDKARYKVPVKTPDGEVDKGALDSANKMLTHVTGVADDVMTKAAKQLMGMLSDAGMKPSGGVLAAAQTKRSTTLDGLDDELEALDDTFDRLLGA